MDPYPQKEHQNDSLDEEVSRLMGITLEATTSNTDNEKKKPEEVNAEASKEDKGDNERLQEDQKPLDDDDNKFGYYDLHGNYVFGYEEDKDEEDEDQEEEDEDDEEEEEDEQPPYEPPRDPAPYVEENWDD